MSDSDSPDNGSSSFLFGIPPEVVQAVNQQRENMHALRESSVRAQDEFLEGLNEEQLRMLRGFLSSAVDEPGFGNYMVGWVSAIMKFKFKVCQYCGSKHETVEDLLTAHPHGDNR